MPDNRASPADQAGRASAHVLWAALPDRSQQRQQFARPPQEILARQQWPRSCLTDKAPRPVDGPPLAKPRNATGAHIPRWQDQSRAPAPAAQPPVAAQPLQMTHEEYAPVS